MFNGVNKLSTTIYISQFGAKANSGIDATDAFRKALVECHKKPGCKLVFEPGRYDFYSSDQPPYDRRIASIEQFTDFTIDGRGSEMIIHGISNFIVTYQSTNVKITNMKVDFTDEMHSMGTVTAVEPTYFECTVHPGYDMKFITQLAAVMEYDPHTGTPLKHGSDENGLVSSVQPIGDRKLRCFTNWKTVMKVGNWVLLRQRAREGVVFYSHANKNLHLDKLTIYRAPGMNFIVTNSQNVKLTKLTVKPRKGASPYQSSGADGIHLSGNTGSMYIDQCHLEGMGDDGINLKTGLYLTIKKIIDPHTVLAQHSLKYADLPDVGDVMELMPQETLIKVGEAKIASAKLLDDGMHELHFEQPLPQQAAVGQVLGNVSRCCNATIKRVTVKNNRARGMLIQNHNTVVDNCVFENCTMGGVWVFNEVVYFNESIAPRNVVVKNCKFKNVGLIHPNDCVLGCWGWMPEWKSPTVPGMFNNITFDHNTIDGADNCAILSAGGNRVTITNNVIRNACISATMPRGAYAIEIDASKQVVLTGNTVIKQQQAKACKQSIHYGSHQQPDEVVSEHNRIK